MTHARQGNLARSQDWHAPNHELTTTRGKGPRDGVRGEGSKDGSGAVVLPALLSTRACPGRRGGGPHGPSLFLVPLSTEGMSISQCQDGCLAANAIRTAGVQNISRLLCLKKQLSVPRPGEELAECRPLGDPGHCSEGFSRIDVTRFLPFT